MLYRVIGVMSGSSLDGLDIVFTELEESGGKWNYTIEASACIPYEQAWQQRLADAVSLSAYDYLLLHNEYGAYIGQCVNDFIDQHNLHHRVQLIASHGHTTFHAPRLGMTAQLGSGAAIAAATEINVVSDLRDMDVAFGGQGAPVVPIGEKLLFPDQQLFLNIGGIANISRKTTTDFTAFDICPANRVLNMLAQTVGKQHDDNGAVAAAGNVNTALLTQLNRLEYYGQPYPKSLANTFGTEVVFPLVQSFDISTEDKLRTYAEHIAMQVGYAVQRLWALEPAQNTSMLVTGGGAFNSFLVKRLEQVLQPLAINVTLPDAGLIEYKEAVVMALMGVLRWREENTVMNTVSGARRSSIGGAVWIGQEA